MGFKTAVLNSVTLNASLPASVKVTLAVGTLEENVTVVGESATVVQTQSPSIATNLTGAQITSLPLSSRNALDSLTSLPGFNTSGTARNSTVSGLPRSAINITLDGMSVQDNYLKTSDGFFARLTPSLDSVEEVTVTTAGNTADATGQGGVQIKFVTKSGTNTWTGTAYEYLRHDTLQRQHLVPQPRSAAVIRQPARRPRTSCATTAGRRAGRADPQEQGVLLLQLRGAARAELEHAAARRSCRPTPSTGVFSYNVAGSVQQREPAAARGGQRSARDARSDRRKSAGRHSEGDASGPAA